MCVYLCDRENPVSAANFDVFLNLSFRGPKKLGANATGTLKVGKAEDFPLSDHRFVSQIMGHCCFIPFLSSCESLPTKDNTFHTHYLVLYK